MLPTKTRSEYQVSEFVDVLLKPTAYPAFPDQIRIGVEPGHTTSFEAYTPNSDRHRKAWKSFEHYRAFHSKPEPTLLQVRRSIQPDGYPIHDIYSGYVPGGTFLGTGWDAFGDVGLPISGLPGMYIPRVTDGGFVPPPDSLDQLIAQSLRSMLPLVKAELSLPNSVYELRDWRHLPSMVSRMAQFTRQGYLTLRNILRGTSEQYLNYKFNIAPMLSDICGIRTALSKIERRINALINNAGKRQVKHFNFTWIEYPDVFETKRDTQWTVIPYDMNESLGYFHMFRNVRYSASVFHAQISYNYIYERYQVAHAQLLGLLDALGVNLNPRIIWAAIPWSFVIDWVIGIGRWLDQFKQLNMEPRINILSYLWSIKRQRTVTIGRFHAATSAGGRWPEGPWVACPTLVETAYRRQVQMPSTASIISSGLDSTEFSLGAALVLSRGRHRKHKR